ncbi:hypothetical protein EYF80_041641 [Liparis tanakae]|uniref:Uncharacterized protein n=1 Tax=Liparis tanakae TaxID=230148 RepID=A0A4Z2G4J7_9TELE|nr:hypothetical protein EYF80_041641 [Liparis tanakae]
MPNLVISEGMRSRKTVDVNNKRLSKHGLDPVIYDAFYFFLLFSVGDGLSARSSAAALCAISAERLWAGALGPGPWPCAGHDSCCAAVDLGGNGVEMNEWSVFTALLSAPWTSPTGQAGGLEPEGKAMGSERISRGEKPLADA